MKQMMSYLFQIGKELIDNECDIRIVKQLIECLDMIKRNNIE